MRNKGFTLLELLVTISVVGVLVALLLPVLKSGKEKSRGMRCVSNLRQIGLASEMYANDYEDYYPFNDYDNLNYEEGSTYASKVIPYFFKDGWDNFWESFLDKKDFGVFVCPSWKEGENNAEYSRMPNRDYGINYHIGTKSVVWNITPRKRDFRLDELENNEINWFVGEGDYRRTVPDFNGAGIYNVMSMRYRHNNTANLLLRDGSVRLIRR